MPIEIRHRWSGELIKTVDVDDLRGADLTGAYLRGADLTGADLTGAYLNWDSHDLISEIWRQLAGTDLEKRMVAGLPLVSRDWCWRQFIKIQHPLRKWAIESLRPWAELDGANPPRVLVKNLAKLAACDAQAKPAVIE